MICVASIPRCGSTYLVRSIAGLDPGGSTPDDIEEYGIIKTHRPPGEVDRLDGCGRAIFLYGDVAEAVVSTQNYRHDPTHFANCGREYAPDVNLLEEDYLGYSELPMAWEGAPIPTLLLPYRSLQHGARLLVEHWAKRDVSWIQWKRRRTNPTRKQREQVERTYSDLIEWVEDHPHPRVTRP